MHAGAPVAGIFAPCALIPIYNHKDTIARTVHALRAYELPVMIVDDGSDAATREVLDTLVARVHPCALICGQAVYDDSVPRARLYGRHVTHFFVWMETLSFAIRDSMCGYRLYPLADTCAEIARAPLPARMDFDTEMAVRLAWRGVSIRNLSTRVIYPENGLSHFRMLHDNLRISAMHTRLLLGMLPRAPRLLWRRLRRARACVA
jgi:glycosyltransferase involved in cell wall biosynthesis